MTRLPGGSAGEQRQSFDVQALGRWVGPPSTPVPHGTLAVRDALGAQRRPLPTTPPRAARGGDSTRRFPCKHKFKRGLMKRSGSSPEHLPTALGSAPPLEQRYLGSPGDWENPPGSLPALRWCHILAWAPRFGSNSPKSAPGRGFHWFKGWSSLG